MVKLTLNQSRILDEIFEMEHGYVLDFLNRDLAAFFHDELDVDIYNEKYASQGDSKAKRLREFINLESPDKVYQLLYKLWEHKTSSRNYDEALLKEQHQEFLKIINTLETGAEKIPATQHLHQEANNLDFDTVSRDLQRAFDNASSDPESAITSACSTLESVCRSILIELGEELPAKKDIKGLYNAVKKPLGLSPERSTPDDQNATDIKKILSGLITVAEGIGALRTHAGDAHGRESGYKRVDSRIAHLCVNSASTIALFLIKTWQKKHKRSNPPY